MNTQLLQLDRVEFLTVSVRANDGDFQIDESFPQVANKSERLSVLTRSQLHFPEEQVGDPRIFVLVYGLKIESDRQKEKSPTPYDIEVEVAGYFRYTGGDEFTGADRFRAIRLSGYQILYGAIREMVCNLTARSRYGLWHLPARNFATVAKERAEEDEATRQEMLGAQVVQTPANQRGKRKKVAAKRSPKVS
ncbi:MAG: hypothetical protein AB7L76_05575 [Burkholderiaceae bacterium]